MVVDNRAVNDSSYSGVTGTPTTTGGVPITDQFLYSDRFLEVQGSASGTSVLGVPAGLFGGFNLFQIGSLFGGLSFPEQFTAIVDIVGVAGGLCSLVNASPWPYTFAMQLWDTSAGVGGTNITHGQGAPGNFLQMHATAASDRRVQVPINLRGVVQHNAQESPVFQILAGSDSGDCYVDVSVHMYYRAGLLLSKLPNTQ